MHILTQAGKCVSSVDVHGAAAADALSARPSEGQSGINLIFDFDESV